MQKLILIVIFLTLFSLTAFANGTTPDIGIEVEPSRLEMMVLPNRNSIGAITLSNIGDTSLIIKADLCDWNMNEQGTPNFGPPAQTPSSCSNWITFNPRVFQLDAGKQQIVRFSISPPPNTRTAEYRSAIYFSSRLATEAQSKVISASNVLVTLYADLPGVKREGQIQKIDATYNPKSQTLNTSLVVSSTGTAHIRFNGQFLVKDNSGKVVSSGLYQGNVVFQGKTRVLQGTGQGKLDNGEYSLEAILSFEGPAYATKNQLAEYPPNLTALKATTKFTVKN